MDDGVKVKMAENMKRPAKTSFKRLEGKGFKPVTTIEALFTQRTKNIFYVLAVKGGVT